MGGKTLDQFRSLQKAKKAKEAGGLKKTENEEDKDEE